MPAATAAFVGPFEKGFTHFQAQRWDEAERCFKTATDARPGGDPPSVLFLERVAHFRTEPPPKDWDGVFEFKTK